MPQGSMKADIVFVKRDHVTCLSTRFHLRQRMIDRAQIQLLTLKAPGHEINYQGFQWRSNLRYFFRVSLAELCDIRPFVWDAADKSHVGKFDKRFPDGILSDAKFLR